MLLLLLLVPAVNKRTGTSIPIQNCKRFGCTCSFVDTRYQLHNMDAKMIITRCCCYKQYQHHNMELVQHDGQPASLSWWMQPQWLGQNFHMEFLRHLCGSESLSQQIIHSLGHLCESVEHQTCVLLVKFKSLLSNFCIFLLKTKSNDRQAQRRAAADRSRPKR